LADIPLALYIHIPWCVQKCPYCDFNSHGQKQQTLPEKAYIAHLLDDLAQDAERVKGRSVSSIFIGGGTPSLFSADGIGQLLRGVKERVYLESHAEITLEANPGTLEAGRFAGYVDAGVNRFSIGVQSFKPEHLKTLGRIHSDNEASAAIHQAKTSQVNTFNVDLMHGLPDQSISDALNDLSTAIELAPPHLSWYQLTIEPNTPFYSKPPELPDDDVLWEIQQQGHQLLEAAGYKHYEISGYAKDGEQCQHNLNYWRFGDYLGIGCGAHGKITDLHSNTISRTVKVKHPRGYMTLDRPYMDQQNHVAEEDRPFEFFMNRFRLLEACPIEDYGRYARIDLDTGTNTILKRAEDKGFIQTSAGSWQVTPHGRRYLNSLLAEFV
jgi:oxygen-independent coproporphyrinogen-3 oxidase